MYLKSKSQVEDCESTDNWTNISFNLEKFGTDVSLDLDTAGLMRKWLSKLRLV